MFLNFDTKTMKEMRGHWVQFVNMSQVVCKQSDYGDIGCILPSWHKWSASSLTTGTLGAFCHHVTSGLQAV